MNRLSVERQAAILSALVEGASVLGTARMMGCDRETVLKLLVDVGEFCSTYQDFAHRKLETTRLEVDEIWAFCGAKARNATHDGHGDLWTFTGIDAEYKLAVSWLVGARTVENAVDFMQDVAARLVNRVQLTSDGHGFYLTAVRAAFGFARVDYAQLVKKYGQQEQGVDAARRYSPPVCIGCEKERMIGRPDTGLHASFQCETPWSTRPPATARSRWRTFASLILVRLYGSTSRRGTATAKILALSRRTWR
ncbi:MAG TPA: IS1 family transposase [Candidatus Binatia bacterium]|jgi:hypothetical protein